jgi:hypothetical protein
MPNRYKTPSVVVIVDVWAGKPGWGPLYVMEPLLKFIHQDFVKCIVVASYSAYSIHGTNARPIEWPIWHSSRQIFHPDLNPDVPTSVGLSWKSFEHAQIPPPPAHELMNEFVQLERPHTDPMLLNELARMTTPSFAAWKPDQLAYLLNSYYPEIENIYLCGGAFDQCLRDRPLGILSLQNELKRGAYKNIQSLLIPTQCVFNGKEIPLDEEIAANPQMLDPNWTYFPDQQLLIPQGRPKRESTLSAAVQAAIQQPMPPAQCNNDDLMRQRSAVEAARIDSHRRRGLL